MSYRDEEGPEDYAREPDEHIHQSPARLGRGAGWQEDLIAEADQERLADEADPPRRRFRRFWERLRSR